MRNAPSSSDDIINSRDIIKRIEELESERDGAESAEKWAEEYPEEAEELKDLLELQDECNYGDWKYGETLIADSYFTKYAEQLADDLGYDADKGWPYNCIDWESAAEELKQDYISVSFGGNEFWIRS